MNKKLLVLPALMFTVVAVFAFRGVTVIDGTAIPSALIGQKAPTVTLEPIPRHRGPFQPGVLTGQVSLVNVWGSWCVNCLYEHPLFLELREQGVLIYGLAWNDTPEAAAQWLERYGNPYEEVGLDQTGRAVVEFGVTGAPETFVIDKNGVIRYRFAGPVTERLWRRTLGPLVAELEAEPFVRPEPPVARPQTVSGN
ncbi:MAG: DsbE family thiol:disulfide interchange protein [Pseudomonadota bacterium]